MFTKPITSNEFEKYDEPKIHMERLLKTHLIEFGLPIRILILLENSGIRTLGDLTKQTKKSLRKIHLLGKTSVERLENFLEYHRLSLAK